MRDIKVLLVDENLAERIIGATDLKSLLINPMNAID
jgi:hypothetical protein